MSAVVGSRAEREHVRWHDLECGGYAEDLPLWARLADAAGPGAVVVRDLGAGTGRVALALARRGHHVEAVDADAVLLRALRERAAAAGLDVRTVHGDVRDPTGGPAAALVLAPMQTIQLLGGPAGRAAMLRAALAGLAPGGTIAIALAEAVEPFAPEDAAGAPTPDMAEHDGVVFSSRPVAVRPVAGGWRLERIREVVEADGTRRSSRDEIVLDRCGAALLEQEARTVGLRPAGRLPVAETPDHVGSICVLLERDGVGA